MEHLLPGETQEEFERKKKTYQIMNETPRQKIAKELEISTNFQKLAERICETNPLFYDKTGMYWLWNHNKQCYEITDEIEIMNIVDEVVTRNTLKGNIKNQIIEAFKREGRKRTPLEPSKNWIQYSDYVYDIETKNTFKPSPKYFFTNPIPHKLGISKETPILDAMLQDWGGEYALTLKQIMAYCTIRDYPIHRIFLLIGSGSNGKGTYLRLLNKFIGEDNVASTEMDMLVSNQFHVTKLHKKLCCQMSETNFAALKNTSMLKKLSGGDLIGFEYKNKKPFDDYNYAKIIIATNSLPVTHDKTDGFYRRWVIVDFNKQFSERNDPLLTLPEYEFENFGLWAAEQLAELIKARSFHMEGTIQDRKERYEARSNPLRAFLRLYWDNTDPNAKVAASDFYNDFSRYLSEHGMRSLSYQVVRTMMRDEGFEYDKSRLGYLDNPVSIILGLQKRLLVNSGGVSVPAVPAVPPKPTSASCEYSTSLGAGTTGTEKWEKCVAFIKEHSYANAFEVEFEFGEDLVRSWVKNGLLIENPYGTYRLL